MGFWSSFCSACSSVASSVSSVVSSVASVATKVVSTAASALVSVGGAIADTALSVGRTLVKGAKKVIEFVDEEVIPLAKKIVKTAKKYIPVARKIAQTIAVVTAPWPWISGIAAAVDKGLAAVENVLSHPWIDKLEKGWNAVKKWVDRIDKVVNAKDASLEAEKDLKDVAQIKAELKQAVKTGDKYALEQLENLQSAEHIIRFRKVRADIDLAMESDRVTDFTAFLAIRAIDKLLNDYSNKMDQMETVGDLFSEQEFILTIAEQMISSDPELTRDEIDALNQIVQDRFNKPLIPFLMEEIVTSWGAEYQEIKNSIRHIKNQLSDNLAELDLLEMKKETNLIEAAELGRLHDLQIIVKRQKTKFNSLLKEHTDKEYFLFASEGLLHFLENQEDTNLSEYIHSIEQLSAILVKSHENNMEFRNLTEDEQSVIRDYRNMYYKSALARVEKMYGEIGIRDELVEVAV